MIRLRKLIQKDIEFVTQLCRLEGWDKSPQEIERYMECEPDGCFIAEVDGKPAGHVFSINYGKVGWIGLFIVHPHHRKKGLGTKLMTKAIEHLHKQGTKIIQLDALLRSIDFHKKLGFKEEFESYRFKTRIRKVTYSNPSKEFKIKSISEADLPQISELDFHYFGSDRKKVLQRFYRDFPEFSFVAVDSEPVGYIMCRKSSAGFKIGPWICDPRKPKVAKALLLVCMQRLEQNVSLTLGIPAINQQAVEIVRDLNFVSIESRLRMRLGRFDKIGNIAGVFAIGDPGKG